MCNETVNDTLVSEVVIIMATFNGERFLRTQLESIAQQKYPFWHLYVSDDGSTDGTLEELNRFSEKNGAHKLSVASGPQQGFAANFLTALRNSPSASYYAFADQDDIWMAGKLGRALSVLGAVPTATPALYCGRTILVDEHASPIGRSPLFRREASFANALVQSIGGGNTMVFNHSAREAILASCGEGSIVSHDWWAYQIISGVGGLIYYDGEPQIYYRQHAQNLVGNNRGWREGLKRFISLLRGNFSGWTKSHLAKLNARSSLLTAENREVLKHFSNVKDKSLFRRLSALRRSGVYRQTVFGQIALTLAVLLNKA